MRAIKNDPLNIPADLKPEKAVMDKNAVVLLKLSMTLQLRVVEAVVNIIAQNIKPTPVDWDICADFIISKFGHAFGRWFDKLCADLGSGNVGDVIKNYDKKPETIIAEMQTKNCLILETDIKNVFYEFKTLAEFIGELTNCFLKETTIVTFDSIQPALPTAKVDHLTHQLEGLAMDTIDRESGSPGLTSRLSEF